MKALSMVLVFAGYVLVYAAVAKQGAFATDPWAGIFADAYDDLPPVAQAGQDLTAAGNALANAAPGSTTPQPGTQPQRAQLMSGGQPVSQGALGAVSAGAQGTVLNPRIRFPQSVIANSEGNVLGLGAEGG